MPGTVWDARWRSSRPRPSGGAGRSATTRTWPSSSSEPGTWMRSVAGRAATGRVASPGYERAEVPAMGRDEVLAFRAIDAALLRHAAEGETVALYLIGRSALIVRFDLDLATRDVDIVHFHGSELEQIAVELFGKGTTNAERFGFHLEPVPQGLPPI